VSEKSGATYADLLNVPEHKVAEIVEGELFTSPRPRIRHARAGAALTGAIYDAFDRGASGPGGWWVLYEPELHLDGDILVPDIAAWRREKLPSLPDDPAFTTPPDWVCEILSPSTAALDLDRKCPVYARHSVSWLWLVEPSGQNLDVFSREGGRWAKVESHRGSEAIQARPFEGAIIDLSLLWP
jgi:Uma2 family endonuclease